VVAATLLVAIMGSWSWRTEHMGGCDVTYQLITPDGFVLNFAGVNFAPGTVDSLMAHDGFGLPPIEHVVQEVHGIDGALYKDSLVKPRTVTITVTTHGLTRKSLHQARAKLMSAMRWDRGEPTQYSILRYTVDGIARDLHVRYDSDVTQSVGRYGNQEIVGFRLLACNPFFYDAVTHEQVLDWTAPLDIRCAIARLEGVWDALGPAANAVAGAGGGIEINALVRDPGTGDIYIGGDFDNWDNLGVGVGAHVARWDVLTQTWATLGGGLNDRVYTMHFGVDGILYAGGRFTNGSGGAGDGNADYLAAYDAVTDTWVNVHGGPGAGVVPGFGPSPWVNAVFVDYLGVVHVGGNFNDWGVAGNDWLVCWDVTAGAWAGVGGVFPNQVVRAITSLLNNNLVVGGDFVTIGAVNCNGIAEYDGTAWTDLDSGVTVAGIPGTGLVYTISVGPNGTLYAGGIFNEAGSGPTSVSMIASWNGIVWSDLDGGVGPGHPRESAVSENGELWLAGTFSTAGPLTLLQAIARWNGSSWAHVPIDFPAAADITSLFLDGDDIYLGTDQVGIATVPGSSTVVNAGNANTYPTIEIKNQGQLWDIRNESIGREMLFDMVILDGEIVEIMTTPGQSAITSNRRPLGRLRDLLPPTSMLNWTLESGPRAQYGGLDGANLITVFINDADPRESGDDNNQLSGWEGTTGISQDNTDLGRLYVEIVAEGGGFYHVDLYMDAARTELVGHTGSYNGAGAEAVTADNDSGLGGTITVDAVVGADVDIEVWFTIVTMSWRSRWWDMDKAIG